MPDSTDEYALYLAERDKLVDAARESARTFDKAVLTFGSAVFGFSIAFLKDIAPNPAPETLKWLAAAWLSFSLGLLAILLSFLFSHRACMFEIQVGEESLGNRNHKRKKNRWGSATNWCNGVCVSLLFFGLLCWSTFAFDNLKLGGVAMNKVQTESVRKGYVPPPAPAKAPQQTPSQEPAPPSQPDSQK
jgi:hypothetical protein